MQRCGWLLQPAGSCCGGAPAACERGAGNVKSCGVPEQTATASPCCFGSLIRELTTSTFEVVCSAGVEHDSLIHFHMRRDATVPRSTAQGHKSGTESCHATLHPCHPPWHRHAGEGVCRGCCPAATHPPAACGDLGVCVRPVRARLAACEHERPQLTVGSRQRRASPGRASASPPTDKRNKQQLIK